jgi:FkbM family methyltransferase
MFLRSWPFKRGVNTIIGRILGRLSFRNKFECVATTDGFDIHVMPNDLIGSFIYLTGEFDRVIVGVLLEQAKAGDVLLDIGANIGYVSACFLSNVSNSRAIAIEPQPEIGDLLEKNLAQFPGRYQIAHIALSNRDGEGYLALSEENYGHSHLTDEQLGKTVRVELLSVERFLPKFNIERAELIKIDVEGHERAVVESLAPYLSRLQTRAILFEDHTKQAGVDGAIGAMLDTAGYEIFRIQKGFTRVDLAPVCNAADCTSPEFIAIKRKS